MYMYMYAVHYREPRAMSTHTNCWIGLLFSVLLGVLARQTAMTLALTVIAKSKASLRRN